MKTSGSRTTPAPRPLGAALLNAHPMPTLLVDGGVRVVYANAVAKRLGVREGLTLGEALACVDARDDGCGLGPRCSACAFRRLAIRALAGASGVERGFVMRGVGSGDPEDLHLLAFAAPFERDGVPHAIVTLVDANAVLGDPGVVKVCEGCGKVQDEEGAWHPLHLYFEDRLGLETAGGLCDGCHAGARPTGRRPSGARRA